MDLYCFIKQPNKEDLRDRDAPKPKKTFKHKFVELTKQKKPKKEHIIKDNLKITQESNNKTFNI